MKLKKIFPILAIAMLVASPVTAMQVTFHGLDFHIMNKSITGAGPEVNNGMPADTPFPEQDVPNTGVAEKVFQTHAGFNPPGSGGILDTPMFNNADFTGNSFPVRMRVQAEGDKQSDEVPVPGTLWVFGSALIGLGGLIRKRK